MILPSAFLNLQQLLTLVQDCFRKLLMALRATNFQHQPQRCWGLVFLLLVDSGIFPIDLLKKH